VPDDPKECRWCDSPVRYRWAGKAGKRNRWHRLNLDGTPHYCGQADASTIVPAPPARPPASSKPPPSAVARFFSRLAAPVGFLVVGVLVVAIVVGMYQFATRPGPSPTARCFDGTLSYSQHHSGTCSYHGGVQEWLQGASSIP
jgi:hypothetical protein